VTRLLEDVEWAQWSNREIARQCQVSRQLVDNIRSEASGQNSQIDRKVERGGTGDDFMPWLVGLLDSGRERLKPHHIAAVLAAQQSVQSKGSTFDTPLVITAEDMDFHLDTTLTITAEELATPLVVSPDVAITAEDMDFHLDVDLFGESVVLGV